MLRSSSSPMEVEKKMRSSLSVKTARGTNSRLTRYRSSTPEDPCTFRQRIRSRTWLQSTTCGLRISLAKVSPKCTSLAEEGLKARWELWEQVFKCSRWPSLPCLVSPYELRLWKTRCLIDSTLSWLSPSKTQLLCSRSLRIKYLKLQTLDSRLTSQLCTVDSWWGTFSFRWPRAAWFRSKDAAKTEDAQSGSLKRVAS